MKAFRFKAARALELRQRLEDDARAAHVKAQHLASSAEVRQRAAADELAAARGALEDAQRHGAPAWLMGWHRSWIARKTEDLATSRLDAAVAASRAAQAEAALQTAHKERRVLERLRDRLAERHAREATRSELKVMNELAVSRHAALMVERKESE